VVNRRKPRVQTPVVSRYPAQAQIHNFVLLFLPPCGLHLILFGHRVHRACDIFVVWAALVVS
jgi:hypothetical protein